MHWRALRFPVTHKKKVSWLFSHEIHAFGRYFSKLSIHVGSGNLFYFISGNSDTLFNRRLFFLFFSPSVDNLIDGW